MRIDLMSVTVVDENDSGPFDSDEPYVLVQVVTLANVFAGLQKLASDVPSLSLPQVRTLRYGPWGGANKGGTFTTFEVPDKLPEPLRETLISGLRTIAQYRDPIWGPGGSWPIGDPDQLFVIVAMMEYDGSSAPTVNTVVQAAMAPAIISAINSGEDHAQLSRRMSDAMASSIDLGTFAVFNGDDRIGDPQELRITPELVRNVDAGKCIFRDLVFSNPSSGYRVQFRFVK